MTIISICTNRCWCEFCNNVIEKGEKYLLIYKNAQKGTARINICKECLIRIIIEGGVKSRDIKRVGRQIMLENLKGNEK